METKTNSPIKAPFQMSFSEWLAAYGERLTEAKERRSEMGKVFQLGENHFRTVIYPEAGAAVRRSAECRERQTASSAEGKSRAADQRPPAGNQLAARSGAEGRTKAESSVENGVAFRQAAGNGASAGIGSGV